MATELHADIFISSPREHRPINVGILALEVYFPRSKVDQADLEVYDEVPPGKYTIGLGQVNAFSINSARTQNSSELFDTSLEPTMLNLQSAMAFPEDQEDVVSMSMTVVQNLMEKFRIEPSSVGRLEVGTESSIDRSKSVKSFLMSLFTQSGNTDIQGVDCVNACYGGTAALFNAVNWVESRSWDGRTAIVVAADVAVYASGPARPSGGCGAVAMLIGPDAPLILEPGYSAAHMDDVYDFYKPAGLFPQAPFSKMVRKGFARLVVQDCLRARQGSHQQASSSAPAPDLCGPHEAESKEVALQLPDHLESDEVQAGVEPLLTQAEGLVKQDRDSSAEKERAALNRLTEVLEDRGDDAAAREVTDKVIEQAGLDASAQQFERMAAPGMLLGRECGNMYAASVHASLASLVYEQRARLEGTRILASSFGSGLAASIYCIKARRVEGKFSLDSIARQLDLHARLAARRTASPKEFSEAIYQLEILHGKAGYAPQASQENLFTGTYYLQEVDQQFRRRYARKS